jgi:hypothetical protein
MRYVRTKENTMSNIESLLENHEALVQVLPGARNVAFREALHLVEEAVARCERAVGLKPSLKGMPHWESRLTFANGVVSGAETSLRRKQGTSAYNPRGASWVRGRRAMIAQTTQAVTNAARLYLAVVRHNRGVLP